MPAMLVFALLIISAESLAQPLRWQGPSEPQRFKQQASNTCGLGVASFVIADVGGRYIPEHQLAIELAHRYPDSQGLPPAEGYNFADLRAALMAHSIKAQVWQGDGDAFRGLSPPVVLRLAALGPAHYVVLTAWTTQQTTLFDPAQGVTRMAWEDLLPRWLGSGGTGLLMTVAKANNPEIRVGLAVPAPTL